jgi:hypothetical protein
MRLWSLHPKYLDSKGIVALWREGLLAKKVLEGKTKGYKKHPQLERFKNYKKPFEAINAYLFEVWKEANKRGFKFDLGKIKRVFIKEKIRITKGQLNYEFKHLLKKLRKRDLKKYKNLRNLKEVKPNPIFKVVKGNVESWEKVK